MIVRLDRLGDGRTSIRPEGHDRWSDFITSLREAGGKRDRRLACHVCEHDQTPRLIDELISRNFDVRASAELEQALGTLDEVVRRRKRGAGGLAAAVKRRVEAAGGKLYPFQRRGVAWLSQRNRGLLADEMGCVDGEAIIHVNRAGKGWKISLADAHDRWSGIGRYRWDASIPTYVRSLCYGELRLNRVRRFVKRGRKDVVRITLESGKSIRVTPDHEIAVMVRDKMAWRRADKLRQGARVLANGQWVDKDGYVRVGGLKGKHPRWTTGGVYQHVLAAERMLGRPLRRHERVHHKNGNRADNRPANLEVMADSQHARHHGESGGYLNLDGARGGAVRFIPREDRVASVRRDGATDVYDIVCENPHRNFVANGIVVHNCGKTAQALMAMPKGTGAVVVCPAVVKGVWRDEAAKWRPDFEVSILKGRNGFRWPRLGEIVVLNYDILAATVKQGGREVMDSALGHPPLGITVIADEAHKIKSAKAQRTRRFRAMARAALRAGGNVWLLTGTPMLGKPLELYNVLRAADLEVEAFGTWGNFTRLFDLRRGGYMGKQLIAGEPDPSVPKLLSRVCMRRTRAQVLPELPEKTERDVIVNNIDATTRRICDEALDALEEAGIDLTDATLDVDLSDYSEVMKRIASARSALAAAKIPALVDMVESYEANDEPLVVFSAHRPPIDLVGKRDGWVAITGDVPADKRADIAADFRAGKFKGLAATIPAAGVGLTLCGGEAKAAHAVFCDLDYTPALNAQAADRLHRIGQTRGVLITRLIADHLLDRHITNLLLRKQRLIEATMPTTE